MGSLGKEPRKKFTFLDDLSGCVPILLFMASGIFFAFNIGRYIFVPSVRHQIALDYQIEKEIFPGSRADIISFKKVGEKGSRLVYEGEVRIKNKGQITTKAFNYTFDDLSAQLTFIPQSGDPEENKKPSSSN